MNVGESSSRYPHKTAWIEGFLRPLFGLVPLTDDKISVEADCPTEAVWILPIIAGRTENVVLTEKSVVLYKEHIQVKAFGSWHRVTGTSN